MMKRTALIALMPILLLASCSKDEEQGMCPPYDYDDTFDPPYQDPVWHPSGEVIGFNYTPLKSITYTYGYDCPNHAAYEADYDKRGFYLVNADGTGQRMALPYKLGTPSWSPDGAWIAFHQGGVIYKMPFDGVNFDTTNIVQLTTDGSNFYPTWSPDGEWIAYDNTNCGNAISSPPPNACGILVMKSDGSDKYYIRGGRYPSWSKDGKHIAFGGGVNGRGFILEFNVVDSTISEVISIPDDASLARYIKYSWTGNSLGIIMQLPESNIYNGLTLYVTSGGDNYWNMVIPSSISSYDWGPANQIVYLNFNYERLDEEQGTLWIMNADGTNPHQLTFHQGLEIVIP